MYAPLLLWLFLFTHLAYAMNQEKENIIVCATLTQHYALDNYTWAHEQLSFAECQTKYGTIPATAEEQEPIHHDLALFGLDDASITIYQTKPKCVQQLVFVDYKQDKPIKAIWIDKNGESIDYLSLFAFTTLVKKRQLSLVYNPKNLADISVKCVRRLIRILLKNNDARGTHLLAGMVRDLTVAQCDAERLRLLSTVPNYDARYEANKYLLHLCHETNVQIKELETRKLSKKQKARMADCLKDRLQQNLFNHIMDQWNKSNVK